MCRQHWIKAGKRKKRKKAKGRAGAGGQKENCDNINTKKMKRKGIKKMAE
jgi:hypothetical protein